MKKWLHSLLRWGSCRNKRQAAELDKRKFRVHRLPLHLEPLEERILMAVVTWNALGDGSSWSDPHNWSTGAVPGATDDVVINSSPASTVQYSGGATTVLSLRDNG